MYQRNVGPQFQFGSPMAQVVPSQGAGGAIPGGMSPMQPESGGMDPTQIGGLLGMIKNMQGNQQGQENSGVNAISQAPNNLGGMPFMNGPQGVGMTDYFKNLLGGA